MIVERSASDACDGLTVVLGRNQNFGVRTGADATDVICAVAVRIIGQSIGIRADGAVLVNESVGALERIVTRAGIPIRSEGERASHPLCDRAAVGDRRQSAAVGKRRFADTRHTDGDIHVIQLRAAHKRIVADFRQPVGEGNAYKLGTAAERIVADFRDTVGNRYARQTRATAERVASEARQAARNIDICQTAATVERRVADARDGIGHRDARQSGTVFKCRVTNVGHGPSVIY